MFKSQFVACLLMFGFQASTTFAEQNITIVTEEWPPYNYMENREITGVSTEIVMALLDTLGKSYEVNMLPSMRTTLTLNSRPFTMMFSMFRTPERESLYKWIGPIGDGSIYFYARKDSDIQIEGLADIKYASLSICSRHSGLIHRMLKEQGFEHIDDSPANGLQIYQKLLAGRCDLAISESDLGVRYILNSLGLKIEDVFKKIPIPFFEADLYLAASQDIPDEEIDQWQAALDLLKANGMYDRIIEKYQHQR